MNIAHIINPVRVDTTSDLFIAQPITFESMKSAKEFAEKRASGIHVTLYAVSYAEDREIVPSYFRQLPHLNRSVMDFGAFKRERKLPLIRDILDALYQHSDADVFIYTNTDIALQPHFYLGIRKIISDGIEGAVINRRTISEKWREVSELPYMYADVGELHPGRDCFVFLRKHYPRFELGNACVGADFIGKVLAWNLLSFSSDFKEFKKMHLTFHIGDDRAWKNPDYNDYQLFNLQEAESVFEKLLNGARTSERLQQLPESFVDFKAKRKAYRTRAGFWKRVANSVYATQGDPSCRHA